MQDLTATPGAYESTRKAVGYVTRAEATPNTYSDLGFMCGLEIHQQLLTRSKLFCRCPAGIYQGDDEFDAELIRHMRPTLSEMGEYDGTALMERKTRKNIVYRIANETACTYDIDDTPPFPIDREALRIALEVSLLLKLNIVGELHITRKQYLDGSIPTGFQRTAIVGIEGEVPVDGRKIRIIQLSIEEDSCRERSDVGHWRVYTTDRLGMPLIETVTYPDMKTPDEAAKVAHYLRFVARSTGHVRTGIGAAREDVNVSVTGGTRVEIKGVAHIRWIPELTHNEAFRQSSLLKVRNILNKRISDPDSWQIKHTELNVNGIIDSSPWLREARREGHRIVAVNLPNFDGILTHFTQPGKVFATEISDRLKVIACIERPNLMVGSLLDIESHAKLRLELGAAEDDDQVVFWGPDDDIATALETIDERCRMAFEGVPSETRKALPDGTTIFERVLPGPDRMYPDTDSAPLGIEEDLIEEVRSQLPPPVDVRIAQLRAWGVPSDCYAYLLKRNLVGLTKKIIDDFDQAPRFVATTLAHTLKHIEGTLDRGEDFEYSQVYDLFGFVHDRRLDREIVRLMLPEVFQHPNMVLDSVLTTIGYEKVTRDEILTYVPTLNAKFDEIGTSPDPTARLRWIMGNLRPKALGNMPLAELYSEVAGGVHHG